MPIPNPSLNVRLYNRYAWDRQVDLQNKFTLPVDRAALGQGRLNPEFTAS